MKSDTQLSYIRFLLRTEHLTKDTERYLEMLGVECIDDGGPFEAFGISAQVPKVLQHIQTSGNVANAEAVEPPSGK